MVKVKRDLTGQRIGKLTVLKQVEDYVTPRTQKHYSRWLCRCDCGNVVEINGNILTGKRPIYSCGCVNKEMLYQKNKKYNEYNLVDNYYEVSTFNGEKFLIDKEDYDLVHKYCWFVFNSKSGKYIASHEPCSSKSLFLHRMIMNCPDDYFVDHINHNTLDNRKNNLRIVSKSQNAMNARVRCDNNSGYTGVYWSAYKERWIAKIAKEGKDYYLGSYKNKEEAIEARKEAEEKYFGEYNYNVQDDIILQRRINPER